MRAVNLIPADARRGGPSGGLQVPTYAALAVLALAVVFVTIYVLTSNTISDRQAKLSTVQAEANQAQAEASRLGNYTQFEKLARAREETVLEIAQTRFDWDQALADLSKVVPPNTSLQSLTGTVVPGASPGGSSGTTGSGGTSLRNDVTGPAFELQGCTSSQDNVARLMSRLRLINNVVRVTLSQSQKPNASTGTTGAGSGSGSSGGGCGDNAPTFDVLVFFQAVPGAGPTGPQSVTPVSLPGAPGGASPASATTAAPTSSGGSK